MSPLPPEKLEAVVSLLGRYRPVALYAFGSRVSGPSRPDSDLDLGLLLPEGKRLGIADRLEAVHSLERIAGCDVDLVIINDASLPVRFDIIRHGRVLWEASFDERTDAEDLIVRDYLDYRPFLERSFREIVDEVDEPGPGNPGGKPGGKQEGRS